jgi:hypothetical protein
MTTMTSRVHSVTQIIMRHDHSLHPFESFFIAKIVLTDDTSISNVLNIFVTIVYYMLLDTGWLIAHFVEVGDFSSSRG